MTSVEELKLRCDELKKDVLSLESALSKESLRLKKELRYLKVRNLLLVAAAAGGMVAAESTYADYVVPGLALSVALLMGYEAYSTSEPVKIPRRNVVVATPVKPSKSVVVEEEEESTTLSPVLERQKKTSDYDLSTADNWGYLGYLDENQVEILERFKASVENEKLTCIEIQENVGTFRLDDECLLRFLRARQFKIKDAMKMLKNHLTFRDKYVPSKITPQDIAKVLPSGLTRFGPRTIGRRLPCTLMSVDLYHPKEFETGDDFTRYVLFFQERMVKKFGHEADKGVLLYDMTGWRWMEHALSSKALAQVKRLIKIVQDHNPERLERVFLYKAPRTFSTFWKLIKPFLDPIVAGKIVFVYSDTKLLQCIDAADLPTTMGGTKTDEYPIEGLDEL